MSYLLNPGDQALLSGQPFVPPVRIESVRPLPWGGWRIGWHHEAPGFGKAPQRCDEPRDGRLLPAPPHYAAPPDWRWLTGADHCRAQLAYLDRHASLLTALHGRDRIHRLRAWLLQQAPAEREAA